MKTIKCVLVGSYGGGKTSLVQAYKIEKNTRIYSINNWCSVFSNQV